MINYSDISFFEFQERFQTEDACFQYLKKLRWPDGFTCPQCSHTEAYFLKKRKIFQCKNCRHQTSITVNTIFHRTHVELRKWFWAIFLVSTDKRGCSAKRLEKQICVHYATAWLMIHKIRRAMKDRDSLYKLSNTTEMDDSYFGGSSAGKRGRGAANKSAVVIAVERRSSSAGYAAMEIIDSMHSKHLTNFAVKAIEENQIIHTDNHPSYNVLDATFNHLGETVKPFEAMKKLPWVHILISNVKSFIRGTYHGVSHKHLQSYLSEFCYRFNRRFNEYQITERLLVACLGTSGITYAELTR